MRCPYCGNEADRNGHVFGYCQKCHRSWRLGDEDKIMDERRADGMVCPFCHSLRVVRNGSVRKLCRDCGKQWSISPYQFAAEATFGGGKVVNI
jgi:ribosomal protein L37AE/L43A